MKSVSYTHLSEMGHFDAVWTTCQTAGRGRRGHVWQNAPGEALYYTVVFLSLIHI